MGIPLNNQTVRTNTNLQLTGSNILPTPYADEKDPIFEEWLTTPITHFQFDTTPPAMVNAEGLMKWNTADGTLDLGMDGGNITLQIGQENFLRVKNETGVLIPNGTPVYFTGSAADFRPTVAPLSNEIKNNCLATAGVTTEDIDDNTEGYVTIWGKVRNIDTSTLTQDALVYVGHDPGELTSSPPEDEHNTVVIGICTKSDAITGEIFVKRPIVLEPAELNNINGFHHIFESTVSWDRAQREFTITPNDPVNGFSFYQYGKQYLKKTPQTVKIDDIEGIHYVYFDNGVFLSVDNLTKEQVMYAIENVAIVGQIYWDATNKEELIVGEERHGFIMSSSTHSYLHVVLGPQWTTGMAINTLNVAGDGSADSHAQFGVDSGTALDEDLHIDTDAVGPFVGLPIFCWDGVNENLRRYSEPGFSVLTDVTAGVGATGRLVYNKFAGGSWSLETVPDNNFVLCHVFSTNDPNQPYIAFIGRTYYATIGAAQIGAESEITPIIQDSLKQEFLPVATIAYQTKNTYANAVKAKAVPSIAGGTYSDWRQSRSAASAPSVGNHNDLPGKQGGAANEYYHLSNAAYTRAITAASAIADGYLTAADWAAFDAKVSFPGFGILAGTAAEGNDSRIIDGETAYGWGDHAGLYAPIALKTTLDALNGLMKGDGAGNYSAIIDNSATWNALVTFPGFAADGVATAGKAVEATDTRLSNARTPTSHTIESHTATVVANQILKGTGTNTFGWGYDDLHNASVQVQTGFATDTYLVNSSISIPNSSLKAKSKYRLRFSVTKTNAGTAALVITVRFGTNGSTADTARLTFTAPTNQTAAVDTATFDLVVVFRTVGSGTSAVISGSLLGNKNTTNQNSGHWNGPTLALQAVSGGFDSTVSNSIIGVSYNGGTSYVGTCEIVEATLENLI
jgi:hypothetical protein